MTEKINRVAWLCIWKIKALLEFFAALYESTVCRQALPGCTAEPEKRKQNVPSEADTPRGLRGRGEMGLLCPSTASLSVSRAEYSNFLFVSV